MLTMDAASYLGPALVKRVGETEVQVALPDEDLLPVRMAMTLPYRPVAGDQLLVVRLNGDQLYAIGVLEGHGVTSLRVQGDLHLEAPNGAIRLSARHVLVTAGKLEFVARRIIEKAHDVYRWISGLLQLKSNRMRTVVESDYHLKAGGINVKAVSDVNIDGQSINLG
ncbi:MAG: DUF3540 domain-containing protein [Anaerolineales bacterium]